MKFSDQNMEAGMNDCRPEVRRAHGASRKRAHTALWVRGVCLGMWFLGVMSVAASAATLTNPADGRSVYMDLRSWNAGVSQSVDQLNDSVLQGRGYDAGYGNKEISRPVFEFTMDSSLYGQSDLQSDFNFYLTQAGTDASGDDFSLSYGQGDGTVQYEDTGGTVLGSVDPEQSGWLSMDVSSAIQEAADKSWGYIRFTFDPNNLVSSSDTLFVASSENTGFEPTVTVVPEPTTLMILLMCAVYALIRGRWGSTKNASS